MGATEAADRPAPVDGFCEQCGQPVGGGHPACGDRREWEPPRYCDSCGRRMVVQVLPAGWRARCSVHGSRTGG